MSRSRQVKFYMMLIAGVLMVAVGVCSYSRESARITFQGHIGPVYAIAYSPDGKTLASGGADGTVKLWDLGTSRERTNLEGHTGFIDSVTFAPDGKTLATTATQENDIVKLWDVAEGELRDTISESERPDWTRPDPLQSPDGHIKVEVGKPSGNWQYKTATLVETATGKKIATLSGHPDQLNAVAFSPDGEILATGGGYTEHPSPVNPPGDIRLWDVKSGKLLTTFEGHGGAVSAVTFSPDGKILASANYDGTVKLWNMPQFFEDQ